MALLLVCKQWHGMAQEILYEHVIFTVMRSLAALGSDTTPFHSTKSLVLFIFDWEEWSIPVTNILKLCENLHTLVLGYYLPFDSDGMRLVINAIPSNLVAFAYIGEYEKDMTVTLSSFQRLEYLSLLSSSPIWSGPPAFQPVFPHVRHITLSHDYSPGWASYFPDARRLTIIISRDVPLPTGVTTQYISTTDQSKVEHLSIGIKASLPRYIEFGELISASFIQGFQNLILLSYNPFIINVSRSHPFEAHRTLQSVRHYLEIPMAHTGKEGRFKASWVQSWNWLHDGDEKFPSLKSIVGVYKCKGASEIEKDLLRYVQNLGGYDPKLTFVCSLQSKEI
jgi:hypothetical protein